ncbi:Imm63 family immunity protein [Cupriavidus basilensis]|uniref:Imm63 family immunity protein n=1 Tax=Cupriavidus basilensis TaxID=68895 RepID=UPI0039F72F15
MRGDILFWFFERVCSNVVFRYELQSRIQGLDPRRIYFAKKQGLSQVIDENLGKIAAVEIAKILATHPFVDA